GDVSTDLELLRFVDALGIGSVQGHDVTRLVVGVRVGVFVVAVLAVTVVQDENHSVAHVHLERCGRGAVATQYLQRVGIGYVDHTQPAVGGERVQAVALALDDVRFFDGACRINRGVQVGLGGHGAWSVGVRGGRSPSRGNGRCS